MVSFKQQLHLYCVFYPSFILGPYECTFRGIFMKNHTSQRPDGSQLRKRQTYYFYWPLRDLMFHLCSMKITLIPQKEEQLRVTEYIGD